MYKYFYSDTKLKGIPDETIYSENENIKFYKVYYSDTPFFLNFFCFCIPKCMFRNDYIFQIGVPENKG